MNEEACCDINCPIPPTTKFMHKKIGVILGRNVILGDNVRISHNVTIGRTHHSPKMPKIEDNVVIYCHSVIIGDITIGKNSIIGAGSVVLKSVPKNTMVAGNPARIIRERKGNEWVKVKKE